MQFRRALDSFSATDLNQDLGNTFTCSLHSLSRGKLQACGSLCTENAKCEFNGIHQHEIESPGSELTVFLVDCSGSMAVTYRNQQSQYVTPRNIQTRLGLDNYSKLTRLISFDTISENCAFIEECLREGFDVEEVAAKIRSRPKDRKKKKSKKDYVSRKQIVEYAVAKYLHKLRQIRPTALVTFVLFSDTLLYPNQSFTELKTIEGLSNLSMEVLVELGAHAGIGTVSDVADKILALVQSVPTGQQTALYPAFCFALGCSGALKSQIAHIVAFTDGQSNVGVGVELKHSQEEQDYLCRRLVGQAQSAKTVCSLLTFSDCYIGYRFLDRIVRGTSGASFLIELQSETDDSLVFSEKSKNLLTFGIEGTFCRLMSLICSSVQLRLFSNSKKIEVCLEEGTQLSWSSKSIDVHSRGVCHFKQAFYCRFKSLNFLLMKEDQPEIIRISVQAIFTINKKRVFCSKTNLIRISSLNSEGLGQTKPYDYQECRANNQELSSGAPLRKHGDFGGKKEIAAHLESRRPSEFWSHKAAQSNFREEVAQELKMIRHRYAETVQMIKENPGIEDFEDDDE